jgi:hypothetical protein
MSGHKRAGAKDNPASGHYRFGNIEEPDMKSGRHLDS